MPGSIKQLLKMQDEIFYIFECPNSKSNPILMKLKLKYPLGEYYSCLEINKYNVNEIFEDTDSYVVIKKTPDCEDNCLCLEFHES